MNSEWMKVMLDEIARKKAEADQERLELERRELERRELERHPVERVATDTNAAAEGATEGTAVVRPAAGRVNDSA
jgi:hypothetical protein